MGWDIFRVKKKRDEPDDDIQIAIKAIEKFAPKKYLQEREMYYYHYRQMSKYLKPLLALLIYVPERAEKKEMKRYSFKVFLLNSKIKKASSLRRGEQSWIF